MLGLGVNKLWTSSGQKDEYAVLSQKAPLVAAFDDEYYRSNGSQTTFSDLITHSRTSNATMVDSDGLIKWGPHNLISYSEAFDDASWVKTNTSVTANAATAPNATTTADQITHVVEGFNADMGQAISTASGIKYTAGIFVKNVSHTWFRFIWAGSSSWINLTTGAIGTDNLDDLSVTNVGDGWYFIEGSKTATSSSHNIAFTLASGNNSSGEIYGTSVYIWGAHVYRSDLGGMVNNPDRGDSYVPTTSSAVYLPRRGHHVYNGYEWVNEGILVESEARTNLIIYSNDFTNAAWVKSACSISANQAVSPDGNTNASKLIPNSGVQSLGVYIAIVVTSGQVTSFYAKAAGFSYAIVGGPSTSDAVWFDLQNGLVKTQQAGVKSAHIEYKGNGWYRCTVVSFTAGATTCNIYAAVADNQVSLTGNGTDGIYIYGGQCELASTPSSLIPTNGSTVTRAAETFTIPSANLPWPTPQYIGDELVTNGTFDTDTSGWTAQTDASIAVVSGELEVTTTAGYRDAYQNLSLVSGKQYVLTGQLRAGTADALIEIRVDGVSIASVLNSSGTMLDYTYTFTAGSTNSVNMQVQDAVGGTAYFDNISVREINPLSVSIQQEGRMTYADTDQNIEHIYYQWQEDANNEINGYISTSTTRTGKGVFRQIDNAILDVAVTSDNYYSPDILVPYNIASRHGSTFVNGAVDGVALTADTTPTALPDLSSTDLDLAYDYNGTIKTFRIWDKDIGDTGIAEATKPSLEPSLSLTFDGQPSSFTNTGLTV